MPIEPRHVDLALDVKRGLKRLKQVGDDDRPFVAAVLHRTTDSQWSQIALAREKRATSAMTGTPCRVFTPKHSLSRA